MKTPVSTKTALRRTFSSLAAIAAISVIFGAKALESERRSEGGHALQLAKSSKP